MVGFQAAGAAPIVEDRVIAEPKTLATAIRIGNPASWGLAKEALADSSGWIDSVTDEEIVRGYRMLAREEASSWSPPPAPRWRDSPRWSRRGSSSPAPRSC